MPYLQMTGVTKYYPGVVANDNVDFEVARGEIHALVGENGAGKSTLMKVLYGMERPDAGQIMLDGAPVAIPNPQAAIRLGIDMVHQHFQLVPSLSVSENVALGYEPRRGPFVDRAAMRARVRALSEQFGLRVDPDATVHDLSVGVQQRVEILKLLYRDARLLILDEPSAVLTPQEVEDLFAVLRRLVEDGRTAIFITHKLREVMAICDRATVLRQGRVVGTVTVSETAPETIAQMMVGRDLIPVRRTGDQPPPSGEIAARLETIDLTVHDDRGLPAVRDVLLRVPAGMIVGLAGVEGNGQHELIEALVGIRKPQSGAILIGGQGVTHARTRRRRELGMAVIPADRTHAGLSLDSTVADNIAATRYHRPPLSHAGILAPGRIRAVAEDAIEQFDIRVRGPGARVGTLSGGNAQKVVIAREVDARQGPESYAVPRLLIAVQPTRGLDVGAAQFVHEELLRLRAAGTGILLVSADLDELLALTDRLLVIFEGRIVGTLDAHSATRETLGLLMAGRTDVQPS